jgi:hypothetical protein
MGLSTGYVRDVVGKHKVEREGFLGWELFKQRIQDEMRVHGKDSDRVRDKFVDFFRDRPENLTCSIRTDPFFPGDVNDCHAEALPEDVKGELEKLDYLVRISPSGEYRPERIKDDVVLHFYKGRRDRPDPYNLNLLWLDGSDCSLDREFMMGFDYILCGSGGVFDMTRKLAPEIRAELVEPITGRDLAEAVHRAVVFLVKNYVDYKSEGLYRLRNGS